MESRLRSREQDSSSWWIKLRPAMQHAGLLIMLMVYTTVGGVVFKSLELPAEEERLVDLAESVLRSRGHFLKKVANNSDLRNLATLISVELHHYEKVLQDAVRGGVSLSFDPDWRERPTKYNVHWNFTQAVFFASTVLTTIGYGNIAPETTGGRAFCIVFALVGIPLTLSVIAAMGHIFATMVSSLLSRAKPHFQAIMGPPPPWATRLPGHARRSLTALAAVGFLFLYLSAGAALFVLGEDDWSFFDGFYFCFVTMTTIGFGDLVPQKPEYMLQCTLYILVGLALTSTIIELVRRQYAQSWRHLQALSGPLAETLRRLGESAGGSIDATALQKMLTIISVPKRFQSGETGAKQRREWEEAMAAVLRDIATKPQVPPPRPPPVLQIVIYESSV